MHSSNGKYAHRNSENRIEQTYQDRMFLRNVKVKTTNSRLIFISKHLSFNLTSNAIVSHLKLATY